MGVDTLAISSSKDVYFERMVWGWKLPKEPYLWADSIRAARVCGRRSR